MTANGSADREAGPLSLALPTPVRELTTVQRVLIWVGEQLQLSGVRRVVVLEVHRAGRVRGAQDEIARLERPGDDEDDWHPEQYGNLANEIVDVAESDAMGAGPGVHAFKIVARTHLGHTTSFRFKLRTEGESDDEMDHGAGSALLAQAYRHNEFQAEMLGRSIEAFLREGIQQRTENARLVKQLSEMMVSMAELQAKDTRAQIELRAADAAEERKDRAIETGFEWAKTAFAEYMAKGKLAKLSGLRDSMTPQQLMGLAVVLSPEQMREIADLLGVDLDEMHQKAQAAASAAKPAGKVK